MKGGTLFSGIGAPELAAPEIDWRWCAEIDPFAATVLKTRFPHLKNLGDVGSIDSGAIEPVDLVVFGSPCQSFSVAGRRRGLDDPRGDLALVALALIGKLRPRWVVFENVPGLLSQNDGRDFGTIIGALGECGFGFAYRVLDAQFAGVPQRRRRVFAIGCLGDWRSAAAVLFEPESLRGDPAPRREAGQRVARPIASCVERSSGYRNDADTADNLIAHAVRSTDGGVYHEDRDNIVADPISANEARTWSHEGRNNFRMRNVVFGGARTSGDLEVATTMNAHGGSHGRLDFESETFVVQNATRGKSQNGLGISTEDVAYTLDNASQHAVAFQEAQSGVRDAETYATIDANMGSRRQNGVLSVALRGRAGGGTAELGDDVGLAVRASQGGGDKAHVLGLQVRRLTPKECERLQGFPDDFTLVRYRGKPAADGPRYRAIGNAMCVPVVRWILERIMVLR